MISTAAATSSGWASITFRDFEAELTQFPGRCARHTEASLLAPSAVGLPLGCIGAQLADVPGSCTSE